MPKLYIIFFLIILVKYKVMYINSNLILDLVYILISLIINHNIFL